MVSGTIKLSRVKNKHLILWSEFRYCYEVIKEKRGKEEVIQFYRHLKKEVLGSRPINYFGIITSFNAP